LNTGIIAMVGASVFQQSMVKMFTLVYSSTLRREVPIIFADSVEEAYGLLLAAKAKRSELVR
jgi:hypothetical protein